MYTALNILQWSFLTSVHQSLWVFLQSLLFVGNSQLSFTVDLIFAVWNCDHDRDSDFVRRDSGTVSELIQFCVEEIYLTSRYRWAASPSTTAGQKGSVWVHLLLFITLLAFRILFCILYPFCLCSKTLPFFDGGISLSNEVTSLACFHS